MTGKKRWLLAFNALTLLSWMIFIATAVADGLVLTRQSVLLLALAQGLAVFEIMNSVLGIAGSNWLLTVLQVSSRLLVTGVLVAMYLTCDLLGAEIIGYPLITFAWGITEVVRALSYLGDLLQKTSKVVTWLRYSLFIGLYPIGVTGEFLILYGLWQCRGASLDAVAIALAIIAISYIVFFPKLFGHMLAQRRKKLD
jgi:very-long-chain (3R)-3-hydroxyacyl-CoA dehydratase